jgi:AcrR family transcriptional regulator
MTRAEKDKKARKEEIVAAAEKVFIEKGYPGSSMDEIAREAQFTKRTLYQYFLNKEDLYFAVSLACFRQLLDRFTAALNREGESGFERLRGAGQSFYEYYREHPDRIRLLTFSTHIGRERGDSPYYHEWAGVSDLMFAEVAKTIDGGAKDGSIRPDLDPRLTAFSLCFLTTGFFTLLALNGPSYAEHLKLDLDSFAVSSLDLFIESLRRR